MKKLVKFIREGKNLDIRLKNTNNAFEKTKIISRILQRQRLMFFGVFAPCITISSLVWLILKYKTFSITVSAILLLIGVSTAVRSLFKIVQIHGKMMEL